MKALNTVALVLLIIGGLNWGLVGLFNFDLVAALFGGTVGPRWSTFWWALLPSMASTFCGLSAQGLIPSIVIQTSIVPHAEEVSRFN